MKWSVSRTHSAWRHPTGNSVGAMFECQPPRFGRPGRSGRGQGQGQSVYRPVWRLSLLLVLGALLQVCRAQQCGSQANNALCRDALCCSQFGYCGSTPEYCGTDCQSNCNTTSSDASQICGAGANNALCPDNSCCSQYGFCGDTPEYCGTGCQSNCNTTVSDASQICGAGANNTLCPDNNCCSQFGFCGTTDEFCGDSCQSGPCVNGNAGGSGLKSWAIVLIVVAIVAACVVAGTLIFCCRKRRQRKRRARPLSSLHLSSVNDDSIDSPYHPAGMTYIFSDNQKVLGMRFTYEFLSAATNGFSKELGRGAFGVVYKGLLKDNSEIAVKSLLDNHRGLKDFEAEIKTLGNINHANLVALRGFCFEPNKPAYIVYEFAPNGSLDKWIFSNDNKTGLPWKLRMDIAAGTAKGLAYLHEDLQIGQAIIHLDIKPENILLDENFTPKVADFGMAKLIGEKKTLTLASGGTLGYMAPETYAGAASTKMDVYSFGVVLLELVCGRRHLDLSLLPGEEFYLPTWTLRKVLANEEADVVDPKLCGVFEPTEAKRLLFTAFLCLQRDPDLRCDMGMVWKMIEGLAPRPDIPEQLKAELDMVERLLRRSRAENSTSRSDMGSLFSSNAGSVYSLLSNSSAPSTSSMSSSSSESRGNFSQFTMQANMEPVPETRVNIPFQTAPTSQQSPRHS